MKTMKTTVIHLTLLAMAAGVSLSCLSQRPERNGVFNENVYLPKDFLTRENPHKAGSGDNAWLFKVTVTKASTPENYAWLIPGEYTSPRYVRFQLAHNRLEMVDDNNYAALKGNASQAPAVLNAWTGSHVDIKMKVNLDGERTNFKEENREEDWQKRQYFKVTLDDAKVPDVNMLGWWKTDAGLQCLELRNVSLVPGSFELEQNATKQGKEKGDDYFSWTLALTYSYRLIDGRYYCADQVTDAMARSTFTYHLKYAFWRVPQSNYKKKEILEKDPMRKIVGAWETGIMNRLEVFKSEKTELPGARSYMVRFDPDKEHTFYFGPDFPEKYKKHFSETIANQFNGLMKTVGKKMRISFKNHDDGGKKRTAGDPRYSMLLYHKVPAGGVIGMAEMVADPRTGETLSATMNMYDWIDKVYEHLLQDYIAQVTKDTDPDGKTLPATCKPGETVKIDFKKIQDNAKATSLLSKLEDYMEQPKEKWIPKRDAKFGEYLRMLLPDLRFAYPPWNSYVQAGGQSWRKNIAAMRSKAREFQKLNTDIDRGLSPFGQTNVLAPGAIAKGIETIKKTKLLVKNHFALQEHKQLLRGLANVFAGDGVEMAYALARSARLCKKNGKWESRDEWGQRMRDNWFKFITTHEFGHDLGLRHNFYGNMDVKHHKKNKDGKRISLTSSVMEYAFTLAEAAEPLEFLPYDLMALKYIYGDVKPDKKESWLFCTDEHASFSPLCTRHDIGTRPTEIVKNVIDYYEWQYKFRNFRAFRKFWNTNYYGGTILNTLYPLRRFLNLWAIDWTEGEIKNDLSLLGLKGNEFFFKNITDEFNDEMAQANRLVANFYKAILQQSSGERSYATKFNNFYGDVTQQGIILDKYFSMFLFVGLWPVDDYDQNLYSYLAYHESSFGNALFWSNVQDITDSMVGGQYDVYPWFKPLAVLLFAQDTHDVMFSDYSKQKWIEMRRFDRVQDMIDFFGFDPRKKALASDNPFQTFSDKKGAIWIYYYVTDRNLHLAASKDWNPVAFKILKEQNESINLNKSSTADDYEIKYYLDFYEYFN